MALPYWLSCSSSKGKGISIIGCGISSLYSILQLDILKFILCKQINLNVEFPIAMEFYISKTLCRSAQNYATCGLLLTLIIIIVISIYHHGIANSLEHFCLNGVICWYVNNLEAVSGHLIRTEEWCRLTKAVIMLVFALYSEVNNKHPALSRCGCVGEY